MTKTLVCVVPASSSAMKDDTYFEAYKKVFKEYDILRMIVVFPANSGKIFLNAAMTFGDTKTKVTPITVKQPYSGLTGFAESLKRAIPHIVSDSPDEVAIITSGGTTKMGHMVKLIGHITSQFGWEVSFLWVAKSPNSPEYTVTYLPKVMVKHSETFMVELKEAEGQKPTLVVSKGDANNG